MRVAKVPSGPARATVDVVRELVGAPPAGPLPARLVRVVRYGTTVATNALLERRGARVGLLVTRGFGDLSEIRDQTRPDLFALPVVKVPSLAAETIEVDERTGPRGEVLRPLDEDDVLSAGRELLRRGCTSLAVFFLHSYGFPEHEQAAARALRAALDAYVVASHEASRLLRAVPRLETVLADAALTPVLRPALDEMRRELGEGVALHVMLSHGGLASPARAKGQNAVLSGPAGGVLAVRDVGRRHDALPAIGIDVGGTSTDVCRTDHTLRSVPSLAAAGVRLSVPTLEVHTVASGGGSVLGVAHGLPTVGPRSVGAMPGPAGYGRGGDAPDAALSDACAVLGRLVPAALPHCFGPDRTSAFDVEASVRALAPLAAELGLSLAECAQAYVHVAVDQTARAVWEVCGARGHDVRDHGLVVFGGAGGMLAADVLDALGARRVLLPRASSVLSAIGIDGAREAEELAETLLAPLDAAGLARARASIEELVRRARSAVDDEAENGERDIDRVLRLRHVGTDEPLEVALADDADSGELRAAFDHLHAQRFGTTRPRAAVEILGVRVRVQSRAGVRCRAEPKASAAGEDADDTLARADAWFPGVDGGLRAQPTPVRRLGSAARHGRIAGPALLVDDVTTIVVPPGFEARLLSGGDVELARTVDAPERRRGATSPAVSAVLWAARFRSIATRMGHVLERVAHSTSIKERLDFSCAVFDAGGRLLVSAPHVPVHLGAMGESVRAVAAARAGALRAGVGILTNDPFRGGSHLPDLTLVTPVCVHDGRAAFFVASRAHHGDVGGTTPGSLPPLSASLGDEGVCVHDETVVSAGRLDVDLVRRLFAETRDPEQRVSDLRAQAAAGAEGARLVSELVSTFGAEVVTARGRAVLEQAARAMGDVVEGLPDGRYTAADELDDGTSLRLAITIRGRSAELDFDGTGRCAAGNLNAPPAVVRAAVLFAFRLCAGDVPLNEGCLSPLTIRCPSGSVLDPPEGAAVVGGNVETSMRVVDLVLTALGRSAASQGTMNNVAFGTADGGVTYYETVGGGAGATPDAAGASAVQLQMTNTRITDPEVLELRVPVLLRRFARRRGSGGGGAHRGGDGIVRELEARERLIGGVLSGRRVRGAAGLDGGAAGAPGRNAVIRAGGERVDLGPAAAFELAPGDRLVVESPGGGGCGGS